jgi:L-ribulose-5-phosphate 4-epimerase
MLEELKEIVWRANIDLERHRLVTLTWGNVSGIDRGRGLIVIKPSGVAYAAMRPGDMVVVDLEGHVVEGELRPSSDTPTHVCLYRHFGRIGVVVHTHSPCAAAFSQACRPIPCLGTTHADTFSGEVPVTRPLTRAEVETDYELNTGKVIVERFGELNPLTLPAVLVANHGSFTWGQTPEQAVEHAVILEEVARIALATLAIRADTPPLAGYILDKHHSRKHGPNAYYGQAPGHVRPQGADEKPKE